MAFVRVSDTDVHYIERGEGPALLFLHGSGSCAEAWDYQISTFSDRFRVIAYDSVNHGHSSNSPVGQPEPDRADELAGFLGALGIERPIIAGNSMGAMTLLRWAVRNPDGARALIPSGMGVMEPGAGSARSAAEPIDVETLFIAGQGGFTAGFSAAHPDLYERYVRLRSTATRIEATRNPRQSSAANPSRDEMATGVAAIRSPMHIINGELDWLAEAGARLHQLVEGSHRTVIAGAPHNVYYEAAEEYNAVVSSFLTEVLAAV
jgi:pimeloyl-ACP methyl ester carboxylesterase